MSGFLRKSTISTSSFSASSIPATSAKVMRAVVRWHVVALRPAAPHAEHAAAAAGACRSAAGQPDEAGDQENRRAEIEQRRHQQRALFLQRFGGDLDAILFQERFQRLIVRERRQLRGKLRVRSRVLGVLLRWVGHPVLEVALDGATLAGDLGDVFRRDLIFEEGVRDRQAIVIGREEQGHDQPVQHSDDDQNDPESGRTQSITERGWLGAIGPPLVAVAPRRCSGPGGRGRPLSRPLSRGLDAGVGDGGRGGLSSRRGCDHGGMPFPCVAHLGIAWTRPRSIREVYA